MDRPWQLSFLIITEDSMMRGRLVGLMAALLVAGLGILIAPQSTAGGLDQAMQNTFGAMVNTTDPSYSTNATRGVLSGGEFVVKNRIMNAGLANLQLPSVSAGCGGWDIFGGSFSFISSAQLVAMARSIASNAVGYAFFLALQSISPTMSNLVKDFLSDMNNLNNMNINSCKAGMQLVDAFVGNAGKDQANLEAAQHQADTGAQPDNAAATKQGTSTSPATDAAKDSPTVHDAIVQGNVIWNALGDQGSDSWFPGGDSTFREQIMSMTGAVITCNPSDPQDIGCHQDAISDPNQQKDLIVYYRPANQLTFQNLVEGSTEGNSVHIYHCNETTKCLNPDSQDNANFIGMKTVIIKLLLIGTCGDAFTSGCGLVGRYAHFSGAPTLQDQQLRVALGDPLTTILNLSRIDENAARTNVEMLAPKMASDLAYKVSSEALLTAEAAAASYKGGDKQTSALIGDAVASLNVQREQYEKAHEISTNEQAYLSALNNNISKARVNILPRDSQ